MRKLRSATTTEGRKMAGARHMGTVDVDVTVQQITRLKLPEPTICPRCGAVYHEGRWQWMAHPPEDAHDETCQACHRVPVPNPP